MDEAELLYLIHYHEVGLKGRNRGRFENQLIRNIQRSLKGVPIGPVRRISGRLLLGLAPDTPDGVVRDCLVGVFGIANFSRAFRVPNQIEALREAAWAIAQKARFDSFKLVTRRSDKSFPMNSDEINRDVGAHVQKLSQATVKMDAPDLTCYLEVTRDGTFVYGEKISGPGGLPVGANERAVSLLSSGIDSPVASYKIMKRGVTLSFVHFHSQPYTNRNSQRNTEELVQILTRYQYKSRLFVVPFVDIQRHIMEFGMESYRVVLYRRSMLRIAEAIARQEGAQALVTGDNVGQVASQTLANMRAIEEVTLLPVLRPLAGDNKEEIIIQARAIGTYETSIEPYEDCCTVFVPKHPETRADLEKVHACEEKMELDSLIETTLKATEVKQFER